MTIKVILEKGEDGFIVAHCPALKSCWSQGKTRDEALANIREAIELYLESNPFEIVVDEDHEVVELTV
ncbi:MAG TPA: type II toxin-antitoxin system HicB family antitoxin [Candidatus Kapabacteria bacterium]|nr:type II toxin-antitoxin system HicB family antitoxin [Candidatus Kapabacteria bacterium]HYM34471.1 type II toxin-antitoxin system HicB family antitoxin [Steroidobacteraceae bacterium]